MTAPQPFKNININYDDDNDDDDVEKSEQNKKNTKINTMETSSATINVCN